MERWDKETENAYAAVEERRDICRSTLPLGFPLYVYIYFCNIIENNYGLFETFINNLTRKLMSLLYTHCFKISKKEIKKDTYVVVNNPG